jgi:hypothetical protein
MYQAITSNDRERGLLHEFELHGAETHKNQQRGSKDHGSA